MSSTISGLNTTDYSYLFSNLQTSGNSSTGSASSFLADYASIKNGSYSKLMRAYYEKGSGSGTTKASKEASAEEAKQNSQVKSDAASVKDAADALVTTGSKSVFNLTDVKDKDGNTTKGYDYDAIYKAVKSFADEYNDLVKSGGESDSTGVLRRTLTMTNETKANVKMLSKVGVTIGTDNKLTIDEKALKKADIHDLKTLFNGAGSFAYNISSKASMISNVVTAEQQRRNGYSASGAYSYSAQVGKIYDGAI